MPANPPDEADPSAAVAPETGPFGAHAETKLWGERAGRGSIKPGYSAPASAPAFSRSAESGQRSSQISPSGA